VHPEKGFEIVDVLRTVAERRGATVAQIALAWLLHQPAVSTVIIGAKKESQLKDNLGAVDVKLDADDLAEIDKVSALGPEYPGWMFGMQGGDRRPGQTRDWSKFTKK
jgi:aryl-alcohol dehydrogenase-like predicted oxidoreductase